MPSTDPAVETSQAPKSAPAIRPPGVFRTVIMSVLLVLLCLIIWGYWTITDSTRVKDMAEKYLSDILGGQVTVGHATLSVFEGLRLDNIEDGEGGMAGRDRQSTR